jgi:ergothioneine biosynthesis protein EgtB
MPSEVPSGSRELSASYRAVRQLTERLCAPLAAEDHVVQSMPDASPAKWHLAHTSWFFETFLLAPHLPGYRPFSPHYSYLFNSYYNALGERVPRPQRGLLSRPTVDEVYRYRAHVDEHMLQLLRTDGNASAPGVGPLVALGLNHEQQHQELLLTDVKHLFGCNPLRPAYQPPPTAAPAPAEPVRWVDFLPGLRWVGHDGRGFAFDNEGPRHRVFVDGFHLASRPVTNAEFVAFIDDAGYDRPELWLSDGWNARGTHGWTTPLYWEKRQGEWWVHTLAGLQPLDEAEPVCHVSYYEADAFARWSGARLPTEAEWETAAEGVLVAGNLLDRGRLHPAPAARSAGCEPLLQLFGDVWEWTGSPYVPYPGYRPAAGALGEYNGKFMCNQLVLRGGSCVTPPGHVRATYRNFFPPDARWQFTGVRLARDKSLAGERPAG